MDRTDLSTTMDAVKTALGGIAFADDAATVRLKSRDFYWFSPILKSELDGKLADLIVFPRDEREVMRAASVAAEFRIPITVRAGGTGNYGQSVPLHGGIVLDVSALEATLWVKPGAGRFQAGSRLLEIDKSLKPHGQELRFYPSTRKQATIGGLVAGGAAGAGTCTWGQISDLGAVLGLRVVTVEVEPRIIELRGSDVYKVMHAYGVNGIITEVEVPLAPSHDWAERIIARRDRQEARVRARRSHSSWHQAAEGDRPPRRRDGAGHDLRAADRAA
jgi:FAD/FMN-containing dehydrogenase